MRVLFWGTPDFATPPLRALLGEGFEVCGVVTQPDKPVGRSRSKLEPPPVKQIALEERLPVLQPDRPRGDEFVTQMKALEPDISVVVAYGNLLPREVIDLPEQGTINIHASLLPKLRGAAPIQHAILEGHSETGISIMRMVQKMDAGPVILRQPTPILDEETYGELSLRLSELGALALVQALTLISLGEAPEEAQDDSQATYAPKIDRLHARIGWSQPAIDVARQIRAFDPKPGAWTTLRSLEVKLFGVRPAIDHEGPPGQVLSIGEMGALIACGAGAVRVAYVHPAGKRRLAMLDWSQGRGIAVGDTLGT
jgi:methionyl-tRNA formyltransferase